MKTKETNQLKGTNSKIFMRPLDQLGLTILKTTTRIQFVTMHHFIMCPLKNSLHCTTDTKQVRRAFSSFWFLCQMHFENSKFCNLFCILYFCDLNLCNLKHLIQSKRFQHEDSDSE